MQSASARPGRQQSCRSSSTTHALSPPSPTFLPRDRCIMVQADATVAEPGGGGGGGGGGDGGSGGGGGSGGDGGDYDSDCRNRSLDDEPSEHRGPAPEPSDGGGSDGGSDKSTGALVSQPVKKGRRRKPASERYLCKRSDNWSVEVDEGPRQRSQGRCASAKAILEQHGATWLCCAHSNSLGEVHADSCFDTRVFWKQYHKHFHSLNDVRIAHHNPPFNA